MSIYLDPFFFDFILFFLVKEGKHTQKEGQRKVPLVRSSCMFSFSSLCLLLLGATLLGAFDWSILTEESQAGN